MIKCPSCGGELKFSPKDQEVVCPWCSSKFNPKELKTDVKHASEHKSVDGTNATGYTCSQCGATIMSFDDTVVTFCNYCDSQTLIESKMNMVNPDIIIPFKKTKDECIQSYKNILNKALFTPKYMKEEMVFNKFRGIYMPYEVYKVGLHGDTTNKGSKYSHRAGDYIIYNDYTIYCHVDTEYDGISFDLSSNFYDEYSQAVPFNYNEAEPFNYNYLIGYYADSLDVDDTIYGDDACDIANDDASYQLGKNRGFSKYGCPSPRVSTEVIEKRRALFPVYFVSIKNKTGDRIHYAVINGQTGKVAMDLPVNFVKYFIFSLILAIPVFILLYILPVITNKVSTIITIIASIIALIISVSQYKKIKARESFLNDEGKKTILLKSDDKEIQKELKDSVVTKKNSPVLGVLGKTIIASIILPMFIVLMMYLQESTNSNVFGYLGFVGVIFLLICLYTPSKKAKAKKEVKAKVSFGEMISKNSLIIIAIIIPVLVLILNPVDDLFYYGASMVSLSLIVISFRRIILEHNILASRPLPQLNKRGGDLSE